MQLTVNQVANICTLVTLLAGMPDDWYDHGDFGDGGGPACAFGHAERNAELFLIEDDSSILNSSATFGAGVYEKVFYSFAFGTDPYYVTKDMVIERLRAIADAGNVESVC